MSCLKPTISECASCPRCATPCSVVSLSRLVHAAVQSSEPPSGWRGCHDRAVNDTFARLASDNDLEDQVGLSPEGLTERYLYSWDMVFRYAFGRWWGDTDLATTAI